MSSQQSDVSGVRSTSRRIGQWGVVARVGVGIGFLVVAASIGIGFLDLVLGVVVLPAIVIVMILMRGREAPKLRLFGVSGYVINFGVGITLFVLLPVPALIFYGVSMLVAAFRGYAGCEILAIPNWLSRRDDRMACPVFSPLDIAEKRSRAAADTSRN
jgi:hypothetical protein